MLHIKFQGHWPFDSGEENIFKVFIIYMGMVAILIMWPGPFEPTFIIPSHGDSIWNLASIGPIVSEKKMFKSVEDTKKMIGELKIHCFKFESNLTLP